MALINIGDLASLIDGRLHLGQMPALDGPLQLLPRIATDLATLQPGELYWELPKQRFTAPADIAYSQGAAGILSHRPIEPWAGRFSVRVANPEKALAILASWARQRFTGTMIAVHGLAGEATATGMIARFLGRRGRSRAIQGDPRATPIELDAAAGLCSVDEDDRYAVLDVHSEDFLGPHCISHLCCPHIAVINRLHNSTANHLSVRSAVARLLGELPESGFAILNGDSPLLQELAENCQARCLWFASAPRNNLTDSCHLEQHGNVLRTPEGAVKVSPPAETAMSENLMACCCVATALGTPFEQIQRELRELAKADYAKGLCLPRIQSWSPVDVTSHW